MDKDNSVSFRNNRLNPGGSLHSSERNSGIELLKIFAILLIILGHVTQTLESTNTLVEYQDYILDLNLATTDLQQFVLVVLRCTGALGNTIFFICSAWFLLDSKMINQKKWWFMLSEIWSVSLIILAVTYILRTGSIDTKLVISSLFPSILSLNWYMTCYLLFYLIHPILNGMIGRMSQTELLKAASFLIVVYIGISFIKNGLLYSTDLTNFIAVYFMLAYLKFYAKGFMSDAAANFALLLIALAGHIGIILLTNFLGLQISFFSDQLLHWNKTSNPFLIIAAICLLNLVRRTNWKNRVVNHLSKQSMLIYIIHENLILRSYYRPYLINYIYESFGYRYIVFWVFALALAIFLASACASLLYEYTLQKVVRAAGEKLCAGFTIFYQKYEGLVLRLR